MLFIIIIRLFIKKTKSDFLLKMNTLNLTVRHFVKKTKFQKGQGLEFYIF